MATLFDEPEREENLAAAPLAERMRPRDLDEVVGQNEAVGPSSPLRKALLDKRLPSVIFWGPPGCGKTTIARILADQAGLRFVPFSAVTSGIKDVKQVMADAARLRKAQGQQTLLFVDEIHRFNKAQQDAFLPYVEAGDIVLTGATTENPSFELNAALLSRCRVVVLSPLDGEDLELLMERALTDSERGLGARPVVLDADAASSLAQLASGDARRALNLLEAAHGHAESGAIDLETVRAIAQRKTLVYDKAGEEHFNLISAFHKSLRESDADAALYWLSRMLESGEDPLYVARRMLRFASEDIGLAAPQALLQASAAWDAYARLGSPEGDLALAQCALYLALSPKSNAAYRAFAEAKGAVQETAAEPVPLALRNAPTSLMKDLDYGKGYVYAHDTETGVGGLECLPEALRERRFYRPSDRGFESELSERLERFLELRAAERAKREKG